MTDKSKIWGFLCAVCVCLGIPVFPGCSGGNGDVAGGLETTNGVVVTAGSGELRGNTVPGTRIIVSDTGYVPKEISTLPFADTVYAEANGEFAVIGIPAGMYNLIAQKSDQCDGCIIWNLEVDSSADGSFSDSSRFVSLVTLAVLVQLDTLPQKESTAFIRGTTLQAVTSADGSAGITGIPEGVYTIEAYYIDTKNLLDPKIYSAHIGSIPVDTTGTVILDLQLQE